MHQSVVWKMVFESLADLTKRDPSSAEWVSRRIAQHCGELNQIHVTEVAGILQTVDEIRAERQEPVRRERVDPVTEEVTVE
jgi:hypothetical protein